MKTVLVIDDQNSEDLDFSSFFTSCGFKTYIAHGCDNGFSITKRYLPDLIITNIEQESEGLHLVKLLIRNKATRNIPIIYLSGSDDFFNQRKVMNSGADDYLLKPLKKEELLQAVTTRLKKHSILRETLMQICHESLEEENPPPKRDDHILVTIGNRLQLIKFKQIVCITALKEYSKIRTFDGKNIIVRKSLKSWGDILPAREFLRIHRASIINVEAIEKITKVKERSYVVYLKSLSEPLEFSQRYANIMRKTFPS